METDERNEVRGQRWEREREDRYINGEIKYKSY